MLNDHISFNRDEILDVSKKIQTTSTRLTELNRSSQQLMAELKQKWNTPKGREFFKEQKFNWSDDVQKYVAVLEALKDMLDIAAEKYGELETSLNNLRLK